MTSELTAYRPSNQALAAVAWRDHVSAMAHAVADMTVEQLLAEYMRLDALIGAERIVPENLDSDDHLTVEGYVLLRQQTMVSGMASARYGVSFASARARDDF